MQTAGLGYSLSDVHYRTGPAGTPIQAPYPQTTADFLADHAGPPSTDLAVNTVAFWPFPAFDGLPVFLSEPVWRGDDRPESRHAGRVMLGLLPGRAVLGSPDMMREAQPLYAFGSFAEDDD